MSSPRPESTIRPPTRPEIDGLAAAGHPSQADQADDPNWSATDVAANGSTQHGFTRDEATGSRGPEVIEETQRFHPAYMLTTMIRSFRGFIIPFAVAIFSGSRGDVVWLAVAVAIAGLTVANAVANWWVSTYQLTNHALRMTTGWLNRQERSVPFERIQSIDMQEPPLARALGVAELRVETAAGGKDADITIQAISRADAATLQHQLLAARSRALAERGVAAPATPSPFVNAAGQPAAAFARETAQSLTDDGGQVIRTVSGSDLVLAGLTSGRFGPAAAVVAAAFNFGNGLLPNRIENQIGSGIVSASVPVVIGLLVLAALVAWLFTLVSTVLSFSGFTLRRDGDQLVLTTGLLERRRTTLPLHRIQSITIKQGLLRQPFGYASVHFVSAGYGGSGRDQADSGVLFPIIPRAAVGPLLAAATPAFAVDLIASANSGDTLPGRALPRYLVPPLRDGLILTAIACVAGARLPVSDWWWGLIALIVPVIGAIHALFKYRAARWLVDADNRLVARQRNWALETTVIPRRREQYQEIDQNLFQRRVDLATYRVRVAGRQAGNHVEIVHCDEQQATALSAAMRFHDAPRRPSITARRSGLGNDRAG